MYCASTDIVGLISESRLARMLDLGDEDTISTDRIESFIAIASSDIDAMLAPCYIVPISGTQALLALKGPCAKLTIELMWQLNSEGKVPDGVKDQADKARETLKALLDPKTMLPDAPRNGNLIVKSVPRRRIERVFGAPREDRQ